MRVRFFTICLYSQKDKQLHFEWSKYVILGMKYCTHLVGELQDVFFKWIPSEDTAIPRGGGFLPRGSIRRA